MLFKQKPVRDENDCVQCSMKILLWRASKTFIRVEALTIQKQQRRHLAHQLFDEIPDRTSAHETIHHNNTLCTAHSVISTCSVTDDSKVFQSILNEFSKRGQVHDALRCFRRMNAHGQVPTKYTLCTVLNCGAKARDGHLGSQVHARMIRVGLEGNLFLDSAMVNLYMKCDALVDAKKVFYGMREHDAVVWTSLISGFVQSGKGKEVVLLFKEMLRTPIRPDCFTFSCVISSCTEFDWAVEQCVLIHAQAAKLGFDLDSSVVSSLVDCYSNCGKLDWAVSLFSATLDKDVILFNSMITGYSKNLQGEEALMLFLKMQGGGLVPTDRTFSSILNSCANLVILQLGRQIHSYITKMGWGGNMIVSTSLTDMYSKCGSIDEARYVFDQQSERNSISSTTMIMGYALSGRGIDGLNLFEELMGEEGLPPDHICFTAVLTCCNHMGLLDKAGQYFDKMKREYNLDPELDQYACMVDLYGKHGFLRKAKKLMEEMPFEPNSVMWTSFLGSCRLYGEVELGREAANQLFKMEPYGVVPYVMLANIYAEAGMWGEALKVRKMLREKDVKKSTGCSWIEIANRMHVFSVNDTFHPQLQDIYAELEKLNLEMREGQFVEPALEFLSLDVTSEVG
ncbi:hypothetical protein Sjap_018879 [Stephania japonica]|uniref:Pentatricopeptide repeat-containing protein n=1 Tax=Stephania japonica TaxID=461633 RepID=A0AAP0I8V2_9MAGN